MAKNKEAELTADELKEAAYQAKIEELEAQLAESQAAQPVGTALAKATTEGGVYEIVVPEFIFKGIKYTAEEAAKNEALINELVEIEAGFLRKK